MTDWGRESQTLPTAMGMGEHEGRGDRWGLGASEKEEEKLDKSRSSRKRGEVGVNY